MIEKLSEKFSTTADSNDFAEDRLIAYANEAEISEYDVFSLAYEWWYGTVPQRVVDDYGNYLAYGQIPQYVRQYLRTHKPKELLL